ncbi:MAG: hypothetical protein ACOCV2_14395 [Persicimonas sp.]
MTERDDALRKLAAVRRDIANLKKEIATADGAMPSSNDPADAGLRNFRIVLDRLEKVERGAGEAAQKLREVMRKLDV